MTCAPFPPLPALPPFPTREAELFGTFTLEVVTPDGRVTAPRLPDWEIRAWPVARLGDATLEVRPRRAGLGDAHLDAALRRAGYLPLGPCRPAHRRQT